MIFLINSTKVRIVGGCCRTGPEHIKALRKVIDEKLTLSRVKYLENTGDFTILAIPRVSSALKAVDLKQVPAPLIIGERINTQGF